MKVYKAPAYSKFNNFCVDKNGKDLTQINWSAGDGSVAKCQAECDKSKTCSGIEWYNSGWSGTKCKLMNIGTETAAKGKAGKRW